MFSLCIPTLNRFDEYLKINLPKYLDNKLIDEIIISDENGNDINKIKKKIGNHPKIKFNINTKIEGPFMNKITACKLAKNEWVALIDSDNFADYEYFSKMSEFINNNRLLKTTILSPDHGSDVFNWNYLSNKDNLLNKETYNKIKKIDNDYKSSRVNVGCLSHLMNTGNFVLNKYVIDNIDLNNYKEIIPKSFSFDVVLFLLICFEQLDLNFYLVNNCKYIHTFSNDSIYHKYAEQCKKNAKITYDKLWLVLSNNII